MPGDDEIVPRVHPLPQTLEERLTAQFYEWEQRGRGWQVSEYPVELEPPFRPFLFHYAEAPPAVDDGRRPTFLSSLFESFSGPSHGEKARAIQPVPSVETEEPLPEVFDDDGDLIELQVALPPVVKTAKEAAERFLLSLKYCSRPVSFEIVGVEDSIVIGFSCREPDQAQVRQQLQAHFPESVITERPGFLEGIWDDAEPGVIVDFGLSHEFMLPLRTFRGFEVDPLVGPVGALADLREQEVGLLQVLFQAARYPWAESVVRAVSDWEGRAFFADAPQMLALAKEKVAQPLFAGVIRVAAQGETSARAWQIVKALGGSLAQFTNPTSNELMALSNDGYDDRDHALDLLARRSRRSGMLLNADEIVSLVHLPSASVRVPRLKREERKTRAAPAIVLGHRYVLGENTHAERTVSVSLSPDERSRHCYLIGASGTGKSTLLLNLILQDIDNGQGVAVLDPHGDLVDEVLGRIPEKRVRDVVLLDPSDEDYPIGFNVLKAHSEIEKNLLGSDLVAVFHRLSTSWGDQMTSVLGNGVLAFLESEKGGTLVDLRRFLIEPPFRKSFLTTVRDPEIVYYWEKSFPFLVGKPQGPILTRLDTFLRPKLIRYMVAQKENRLDIGTIMNEGKIFLAKLAQGTIGEENAYLLGTLIVSKFHQLAMSRQQMAAAARKDFYLYIDEFHNFVTPSMAAILSGARKYRLGLILAHQELQQLRSRNDDVASAVIANPYTRICFRLGDLDAKKLEDGFSYFDAKDLQNLEVGEAICRVERAEYDFNLKTLPLPAIDPETARKRREQIMALSRERYATPREAVAALLKPLEPQAVAAPVPDAVLPRQGREERPPLREKAPEKPEKSAVPAEAGKELVPVAPLLPGRGGPQHKYLQDLIKRWAEGKGYRTAIEKPILDGRGSVDVALEKDGRSIACEISVTTTVEHEAGNIQKCLAAGFEYVVLVSSEKRTLTKTSKAVKAELSKTQMKHVRFLAPDELFAFVQSLEAMASGGQKAAEGEKEVLTAKELEGLLKIDVKTIYSYAQKGLLPYVRIQSNLRFLRSEILKWIEEHRFRPKPPGSRK